MNILFEAVVALLLLTAAVYVHRQLPVFTTGRGRIVLVRTILILTAIGFGLVVNEYMQSQIEQVLAFVIGFGIVHVPAAVVLLVKAKRGEGKS